jgi:hypothetical protein
MKEKIKLNQQRQTSGGVIRELRLSDSLAE